MTESAVTTPSAMDPAAGTAGLITDIKPTGYYLAAFHHRSPGAVLWWGPDQRGYTPDLEQAGIYSAQEAAALDKDSCAVPVPVGALDHARVRQIVDPGDFSNVMFRSAKALRVYLAAAGSEAEPPMPQPGPDYRRALVRLLRELHRDGILSEQQCARRLDVDLVTWRGIADGELS